MFHALCVVVTAGPWTPRVLSGQVELPQITATREQPMHLAVRNSDQPWPCFVQWRHGTGSYGKFESYGLSEGALGVKFGLHASGPVVDPDQKDPTQDPGVEEALLDYVHQWFPGLDPQSLTTRSCFYDNPETNRFIIDMVGPITLAAGFHGQGFKFVPVMGELLRDLAFRKRTPPEYFSLTSHREAMAITASD